MSQDEPSTRVDGPQSVRSPDDVPEVADPYAEIGALLGRYVLVEHVGQGGMGTVARAYDPRLHREVALKRVHQSSIGRDAADRLTREAQAMAQLSHPNVVAVYDVEVIDGAVVIAMEYVAGPTLDVWCRVPGRRWLDVVDAYLQAGRGLEAAHRAQLVHRDFKPSNVLVANDGRVKVMDFGLAKQFPDAEPSEAAMLAFMTSGSGATLDRTLTRADTIVGTPKYMAPEQHLGEIAGATADQYAFCVALWETLTGRKLFHADSIDALASAKRRGPPAWPGADGVPAKLGALLHRGLAVDPDARWPDMTTLLDGITTTTKSRARWRWLLAAGGGAAVIGAIAMSTRTQSCTEAGGRMRESWNDERREAVSTAVTAGGSAIAADVRARVESGLDAYVEQWQAAALDACEARHVRHEQSDQALDLRAACLERRRVALGAAVEQLATDPGTITSAIDLVVALPLVAPCSDVDALAAEIPPPDDADLAAEVDGARAELARASTQFTAGHFAEALEIASTVQGNPSAMRYIPVRLEADLVAARALEGLARWHDAEALWRSTLATALEHGADELAAEAAIGLTDLVGYSMERTRDGRFLAPLALALARRRGRDGVLDMRARTTVAGVLFLDGHDEEAHAMLDGALAIAHAAVDPDELQIARARSIRAELMLNDDRTAESEQVFREVLDMQVRLLGPEHPDALDTHDYIGATLIAQGRYVEAEAEQRITLESRERVLGPDHPETITARVRIANNWLGQGRFADAEATTRAALEVIEHSGNEGLPAVGLVLQSHGMSLMALDRFAEAHDEFERAVAATTDIVTADHPNAAGARVNLGKSLIGLDRLADAEREFRGALTTFRAAYSDEHHYVAETRFNLADVLDRQGKHQEAETELRIAVPALARALGDEHPQTATARNHLGGVLEALGKWEEAEVEYRESLRIIESLGMFDANNAIAHFNIGNMLLARGRVDEALPLLERAVELVEPTEARGVERGVLMLTLAEALVLTPSSRARGVEIARAAKPLLEGRDDTSEEQARVAKLLERHDP